MSGSVPLLQNDIAAKANAPPGVGATPMDGKRSRAKLPAREMPGDITEARYVLPAVLAVNHFD